TVFVSSHLLSEMSLTASELVVIGKGELVAHSSTEDFVARATEDQVKVRSPQLAQLRAALHDASAQLHDEDDHLLVSGMDSEKIGEIAAQAGVVLHELSPQQG